MEANYYIVASMHVCKCRLTADVYTSARQVRCMQMQTSHELFTTKKDV